MKKFVIVPAVALLMVAGVFALGQQSKTAHAQAPTTLQTKSVVNQPVTVTPEKTSVTETGTEIKGTETSGALEVKGSETDGPGGHQDAQTGNTNHDFQGAE